MSEKHEIIQQFMAYLRESNYLPHMILQTRIPGTHGFPAHYIKDDGRIVLNLSEKAALEVRIGIYQCQAELMFSGVPTSCVWHPEAIEAVYSPSPNGPKLIFGAPDTEKEAPINANDKPTLRIVK